MEGNKEPVSSSPPAQSSSSLVADLFGEKNAPKPSPTPFPSVFPPASTMVGTDSSRLVILDPSGKHEAQGLNSAQNVSKVASTSVSMCPDSIPEDNGQRDKNPAYERQKINPCSFSSSLYYGGQDFCFNVSSSRESESNDKKDVDDDSSDPNAVSRGNWWQGSLYY